jgi:hypothetical protein
MERDLRKREGRSQQRGHSRGGRGKFRGRPRQKDLGSNEFRFQMDETDAQIVALRRATLDACYKPSPGTVTPPESPFSQDEVTAFSEILAVLSLDEQISQQFLVEIPPLEKKVEIQAEAPAPAPAPETAAPKPAPKADDLNAWLDDLLS